MKLSNPHLVALSLLALPYISAADFGSGRKIPQIEAAVASIQSQFRAWVNFAGNEDIHFKSTTHKKEPVASEYWLANIKHRGVAPYAQSGYQVFRNVKDFGAKGRNIYLFSPSICAAVEVILNTDFFV